MKLEFLRSRLQQQKHQQQQKICTKAFFVKANLSFIYQEWEKLFKCRLLSSVFLSSAMLRVFVRL